MKSLHERAVDERLGPIGMAQREVSERMVGLLALWEARACLDCWQAITSSLNQPHPIILDSHYDRLIKAGQWMLSMRWPTQYTKTARALDHLNRIVGELLNHLNECMTLSNDPIWKIKMEYKQIGRWDPPLYKELFGEFQTDRNYLYVLVIEATKAINWVIEVASGEVDPFFRLEEGVVLMGDGDGIMESYVVRMEYESGETPEERVFPGGRTVKQYIREKIATNAHFFDKNPLSEVVKECCG
ncbi:hypothetical protein [Streptomyces cyaneofuscatus]|uniref:hypothetical protein n=1 Tax=Streptomyces cyaneofuscatus TaxID=66883 RepID=UPI00341C1024